MKRTKASIEKHKLSGLLIPGVPDDLLPKLALGAVVVVGVGVAGYFGYQYYQKAKQSDAQDSLSTFVPAEQANILLKLLHPKSYEKAGIIDVITNPVKILDQVRDYVATVDKNEVIKAGQGIKDLPAVNAAYSALTKSAVTLADDIRQILDAKQQKAFYANAAIATVSTEVIIPKVSIIAAPTTANKLVQVFADKFFKKLLYMYKPGTLMGTSVKKIVVPYTGPDGIIRPLNIYELTGDKGLKDSGQTVYVLASQVTTKAVK